MAEDRMMMMAAGQYPDVDTAMQDFRAVEGLHDADLIGRYDAAVFEKTVEGKVKVVKTSETARKHGAWGGLVIGAVLGLVFPPSILLLGAAGAAVGAFTGHVTEGIPHRDLKQFAEELPTDSAGLVVVAETTERDIDKAVARADRKMKHEVDLNADELDRTAEEQMTRM